MICVQLRSSSWLQYVPLLVKPTRAQWTAVSLLGKGRHSLNRKQPHLSKLAWQMEKSRVPDVSYFWLLPEWVGIWKLGFLPMKNHQSIRHTWIKMLAVNSWCDRLWYRTEEDYQRPLILPHVIATDLGHRSPLILPFILTTKVPLMSQCYHLSWLRDLLVHLSNFHT